MNAGLCPQWLTPLWQALQAFRGVAKNGGRTRARISNPLIKSYAIGLFLAGPYLPVPDPRSPSLVANLQIDQLVRRLSAL